MPKNPQYERLIFEGHLAGFRRTVVEYLPAGEEYWQLDPILYDPNATVRLSKPPMGIENLSKRTQVDIDFSD